MAPLLIIRYMSHQKLLILRFKEQCEVLQLGLLQA